MCNQEKYSEAWKQAGLRRGTSDGGFKPTSLLFSNAYIKNKFSGKKRKIKICEQ